MRNEAGPPIEHLVSAEIAAACAIVFVEFECDGGIGPPLWLKREAEFTSVASMPHVGIGRSTAPCWRALELPSLRVHADTTQLVRELDVGSARRTTRSKS